MTAEATNLTQALSALEYGQYQAVITLLTSQAELTGEGWRVLGLAYLRSGHHEQAEQPLGNSSRAGDQEGQVEYGNLLRLTGRLESAIAHFAEVMPNLTGELRLRAQRWCGTAEFQLGNNEIGLQLCEQAWYGYMSMGDDEFIGKITHAIAQMNMHVGYVDRANQLFQEAIYRLRQSTDPKYKIEALGGLAETQLALGELRKSRATLDKAQEALKLSDALISKAQIISTEADYYNVMNDEHRLEATLLELRGIVEDMQDYESSVWTAFHLSDLYSLQSRHTEAMDVLYALSPEGGHPLLAVARGMLMRRRFMYASSILAFEIALKSPRIEARDRLRALLHLADAYSKNDDVESSNATLKLALEALLSARDQILYSPDISELTDLVQHALLDPELSPYMELVLDRFAALHGKDNAPDDTEMHLRVQTLGRAAVTKDGEEIHFSLNGSVLTLVYLALHPNSSRKDLETTLYPEREGRTAGDYFRAVFRELRVKLGQSVLWMDGSPKSPRYRLGPGVFVDLDIEHLREALRRGDTARALALYRGSFLPDSKMESDWVDNTREELRRDISAELKSRLDKARESGDLRRALLLANQYLKIDPQDIEMLTERVEVARQVASPQDLARYVVELQRQTS